MKRKHTDKDGSEGSIADCSDEGEELHVRVGGADESDSGGKSDGSASDCEEIDDVDADANCAENAQDMCDHEDSDGSDYGSDDYSVSCSDDDILSVDVNDERGLSNDSDELVQKLTRYTRLFKNEPPTRVDFSFGVPQQFRDSHMAYWKEFIDVLNSPNSPEPSEHGEKWEFVGVSLPNELLNLLRDAFDKRHLASLVLGCNFFGREGIRFVSDVLESSDQLYSLKLNANQVEYLEDASRLMSVIREHPSLKSLQIQGLNLELNWGLLSMTLGSCSNIISLDLQHNNIRSTGMAMISEYLATNPILKCLILTYNEIVDEDMTKLAEALKSNTNLSSLGMTENPIGPMGRKMIDRVLYDVSSLNAVSDSNHECHVNITGDLGCGTTWWNQMNRNDEGEENRKQKLFAAICGSYQQNRLGKVMENIALECMPRVLALIQQDVHDMSMDVRDYSLLYKEHLLSGDALDLSFVGCSQTYVDMSSRYESDESSSVGSSDSCFQSLVEDDISEDILSCDSSMGSEDYEDWYVRFGITLMFEILRGWTMPMLASSKDQARRQVVE